jgi:hypothetical protein
VWAYVLAWVASLSVGLTVLVAGFGSLFEQGSSSASTAAALVEVLLGAALVAWGVERVVADRAARRAATDVPVTPRSLPGWMKAIEEIGYMPAFLLGIYSATWPTVIAAAGEIASADISTNKTIVTCLLFVAVGSSTIVAVAAIGTFSDRSDALLERLRGWLTIHSRAVITGILVAVGAVLGARGLGGLR